MHRIRVMEDDERSGVVVVVGWVAYEERMVDIWGVVVVPVVVW